ncbi:MAG: hypothetical protein ACK5IB_07410, partial [Qingshengfaniella sp.]
SVAGPYGGHHAEAWELLRGDPAGFTAQARAAAQAGARVLFVSAEDLESLIFRPDLALRLIAALKDTGVTEVEFPLYVRRQDKLFWSHHSELSKHVFTDPLQMFSDVLRLGYLLIDNPRPWDAVTPYAYFCFDHGRHIPAFRDTLGAAALPTRTSVFDFDHLTGQPGDEIFARMGLDRPLTGTEAARNSSLDIRELPGRYTARFEKPFEVAGIPLDPGLRRMVYRRQKLRGSRKRAMSEALIAAFADNHARLLGDASLMGHRA